MIIKGVKLHNIRSYLDENIEFPLGSTLLAGDVGSGKSSILLAIEFALFGITRGVVSGGSLLRSDKEEGFVELRFTIDGKEVIIKRVLKKQKQDVRQDSGYIIIDGRKQDATHVELKSTVLELLGYPDQLLTKSKSLIYRYTVYTPQEEMKQILMENSEYRVDTLRKVFQIDKYRKIRENTQVILKNIKQQQNILAGALLDLDEKKEQFAQVKHELSELKKISEKKDEELKEAKVKVAEKHEKIIQTEGQMMLINEHKSKLQVQEAKLNQNVELIQKNVDEKNKLDDEVNELLRKSQAVLIKDIAENPEKLAKMIEEAQEERHKLVRMQSDTENNIKQQNFIIKEQKEVVDNIGTLNKCPLCQQEVTPEHILQVKEKQAEKIKKAEQIIIGAQSSLKQVQDDSIKIENLLKELNEKQSLVVKQEMLKKDKQNILNLIRDKKERMVLLTESIQAQKKEVGTINAAKLELQNRASQGKDIEEKYKILKQELESAQKEVNLLTASATKARTEYENAKQIMVKLEEEINKKKKSEEKLKNLRQVRNWIQEMFLNLMATMEQHVMMRVYNEFNEIFQEFFDKLVESDIMTIKLDETFSPVIEQNGYEVDYEFLSGGEKTGIALSYRLALNKVINQLIENIKTKDLIILDEPTDGFSSAQLDKIRDVLDVLDTKQTIIVSHESKIESFVENIIRINKHEHTSTIA